MRHRLVYEALQASPHAEIARLLRALGARPVRGTPPLHTPPPPPPPPPRAGGRRLAAKGGEEDLRTALANYAAIDAALAPLPCAQAMLRARGPQAFDDFESCARAVLAWRPAGPATAAAKATATATARDLATATDPPGSAAAAMAANLSTGLRGLSADNCAGRPDGPPRPAAARRARAALREMLEEAKRAQRRRAWVAGLVACAMLCAVGGLAYQLLGLTPRATWSGPIY